MSDETYCFYGIDGQTGDYSLPQLNDSQIAALARGLPEDKPKNKLLQRLWELISGGHYALPVGVRQERIEEAGWGVVFHRDEDPRVRQGLEPLIAQRAKQVGNDKLLRILEYRDGEEVPAWLQRHEATMGDQNPYKMPYYLLLVGGPERIPFGFQQTLDVGYAVGRLHFDDPYAYARYAKSVIDYETGQAKPRDREALFFGTRHEFDAPTQLSADHLVMPLADGEPDSEPSAPPVTDGTGYAPRCLWGPKATKEALLQTLAGKQALQRPAFLFTASHGQNDHYNLPTYNFEVQKAVQGALIAQSWERYRPVTPADRIAAADIADDFDVHGLIVFLFACFSAGAPSHNRFIHTPGQAAPRIAAAPFTAALPQALLGHPNGGALACIGHVDSAWPASIKPARKQSAQLLAFRNAIKHILLGHPVGLALETFNDRYSEYSTSLTDLLEEDGFAPVEEAKLSRAWLLRNEAQGYVLLGDPGVRLNVPEVS